MSRFHDVIDKWKKAPPYEGVRVAEWSDFTGLDDLDWLNIEDILTALEWQELLVFDYKGRERLVAPFVFGVSSEGNALMRGFLLEGSSRSGKGPGWRVFQVREMSMVGLYGEWFIPEEFDFDMRYPWVYKVFKMIGKEVIPKEWLPVPVAEKPGEVEVSTEEEKYNLDFEKLKEDLEKATDIPEKDQVVLEWLKKYSSVETITIGGPSTDREHEAYSANIGGTKIYFDELDDAAVTLAREMIGGAPMPNNLKELIGGVQIVAEDARGGPDVISMNADGFITIFGNRQIEPGTLAHEAAHELAVNKWGDSIPPEDSDYSRAINSGEAAVSAYSARNRGEDFAEAVRMFVVAPGKLKEVAPRRYQVIKRLMEDKGYGG